MKLIIAKAQVANAIKLCCGVGLVLGKAKTKKAEKTFDAVKSMRAIKEQISLEIADMNFEQLKAYF